MLEDRLPQEIEARERKRQRRALSEHRVAVVVAVPVMEGGWEESKEKADTSCCSSLKRIRINKQPNQEHLCHGTARDGLVVARNNGISCRVRASAGQQETEKK